MAKFWGQKRYNSLSYFLKEKYGEKVMKISLDAGFTCPNRDGKVSKGGCIFCNESGSGDFTGESINLVKQFYEGVELMARKWKKGKYIAYFQAYTNTYGPIEELREKYYSILDLEGVCGIAIATRPDCLSEEVLELLCEINQKKFLWVELGFQTSKEETVELINRGYENEVYSKAAKKLRALGINFVTHIIFGLPGETSQDMYETLKFVIATKPWGVKFHLLHLMKDTKLESFYQGGKLKFLERNEYVDLIINALEMLPEDIVVHRLTGDSPRRLLIGPTWSTDKWDVLNGIDKGLEERGSWQGRRAFEPGEV
jgi:uncharacterized protein